MTLQILILNFEYPFKERLNSEQNISLSDKVIRLNTLNKIPFLMFLYPSENFYGLLTFLDFKRTCMN